MRLSNNDSSLQVGIIGLGDIAQKGYLPVIGTREEGTVIHLCTRNRDTLNRLGIAYGVPPGQRHGDVEALLREKLDAVFVHAATEAHYAVVKRCLEAGLHVFVDKPLDYSLEHTEELQTLARRNQRILMVGFNRRYAPMYHQLQAEGPADIAIMQKNRVSLPGAIRTFVYDDFIHVIDTLNFLQNFRTTEMHVQSKRTLDGKLAHVVVELIGGGTTAIGIMNRDSGVVEETLEWMVSGKKRKVVNLREMVEYEGNEEKRRHAGDWVSVGKVRGFDAMIDTFLSGIRSLRQGDALAWEQFSLNMERDLLTHRLCESIVLQLEQ